MDAALSRIFYNTKNPASFSTARKLWQASKQKFSLKNVQKWLQSQDAYTLHQPRKKKFKTNRIFVTDAFEQWQVDLVDLSSLKNHNDGTTFLLTAIDVLTKKAFVRKLKSKSTSDVRDAFLDIFHETKGQTPQKIQSDSGNEFKNHVSALFRKKNIHFFVTRNPYFHCAVIERFNRSLKTKMFKYFTYKNTYRYVDVLDNLVFSYNKTKNSATKFAPDAINSKNKLQVWRNLYMGEGRYKKLNFTPEVRQTLRVGDYVRLSKEKTTFEKGYTNNWTKEIFQISGIKRRVRPMFEIIDVSGERILGNFYQEELQKVNIDKNTLYKIEKIIQTKGRGKNKKYFVKWLNYTEKFNSWVLASQVANI